jgi:single-stranded DNA-binding protein|nr:MAG TPA: Single stranded DNA binding protein [Caudoviricetes sp.]
MAAEITVTGTLTRDPEIKYAQSGTAMLKLALAATRRQQSRDTKQWEDDGDPLYIDVTFFGDRESYLGDILHKGDQLSVSGALVRRNWESGSKTGVALEVRFPKLLGYMKKADKAGGVQALAPTTSNTFSAPF